MTQPDYTAWFQGYAAAAITDSLDGTVEHETIRSYYGETVLALTVDGALSAVSADNKAIGPVLERLYDFYVAIGTRKVTVDRVEVSPLYENHDRVRVFYTGHYEKPRGGPLTIPFDVVYLIQRRADGPVIFAFIAGDETALYREHGLVDEAGQPVPRVAVH